jgi:hypothetical protein
VRADFQRAPDGILRGLVGWRGRFGFEGLAGKCDGVVGSEAATGRRNSAARFESETPPTNTSARRLKSRNFQIGFIAALCFKQ